MSTKPWQYWAINPKQGIAMKEPKQLVTIIKKASRPIIVVGGLADQVQVHDGKTIVDIVIELGKNIPVVATAHISKALLEKGFKPAAIMTAVDITQRLADPEWKGLDGKGKYDLAIYTGMTIYLELQMLSRIKHYADWLKSVSLERFFIPNADIGLANLKDDKWKAGMKEFMEEMKK